MGQEMHERLLRFINHYQNVDKELDSAVTAYNSSISSFDSRLIPQRRRFAALVKGDEDQMPEPPSIQTTTRASTQAPLPEPSDQEEQGHLQPATDN